VTRTDIPSGSRVQPGSWVYSVQLDRPSFEDNTGDVDRLLRVLSRESGLPGLTCDLEWMTEIPRILRDNAFALRRQCPYAVPIIAELRDGEWVCLRWGDAALQGGS